MNKKHYIKGATMAEYVLLVALIAAGAVLALTTVGTNISAFFTGLGGTISDAAGNL